MKRTMSLALGCLLFLTFQASNAKAKPSSPLSMEVSADASDPYRVLVTVEANEDGEFSFHRGMLRVKPEAKRARTCRYIGTVNKEDKTPIALQAGQSHREWVDLRMFCRSSANLSALLAADTLRFDTKTRVKVKRRRRLARLRAALVMNSVLVDQANKEDTLDSTLRLRASHLVSKGRLPTIRLSLHADQPTSIYFRDDRVSFKIDGQDAQKECAMVPLDVNPLVEFFRKVSPKRKVRRSLSMQGYCGAMPLSPGVYRVIPSVDFPYDGSGVGVKATTGRVVGKPSWLRVTSGEGSQRL